MSLKLKPGVKIQGLHPEMILAAQVASDIYTCYGVDCWLTSALDGKHGRGSLHFKGYAIDIRTRNLEVRQRQPVADEIKRALGAEFDVVFERRKFHIHIEFDPKV